MVLSFYRRILAFNVLVCVWLGVSVLLFPWVVLIVILIFQFDLVFSLFAFLSCQLHVLLNTIIESAILTVGLQTLSMLREIYPQVHCMPTFLDFLVILIKKDTPRYI